MARRARSIWERLAMESVEGPTVTFTLSREVAQELVGVLMGSLEMDGGGMEGDEGHLEPDEDDVGGAPDGDADDLDPLAALVGDDDGGGTDVDLDEPDDSDDDDSDDDDDDDEKPDEATDYRQSGGDPSGMRPGTALGERRRVRPRGR